MVLVEVYEENAALHKYVAGKGMICLGHLGSQLEKYWFHGTPTRESEAPGSGLCSTSCATLGKSLGHSGLQLPHLNKERN